MYKKAIGASAIGFGGFTYMADPKEYAYKRPIVFWGVLAPIFAHYKYVEYITQDLSDEEQDIRFKALHVKYAPKVLELFFNLRGLFVKLGQVACSREDALPKEYRDVFKVLLDHAPSVKGKEAYDLVEKALGRKIESVFSEFDSTPLGAASIGQVHAGTLHDGTKVVIKIQFPETKRTFDLDFMNGRFFSKIAKPDQLPFLDEFEKQFKLEFDFMREANNLQRVGNNIHPYFKQVRIPKPYLQYCTPTCVVMERFYGLKMLDGFKYKMNQNALKMGFKDMDEMKTSFNELQQQSWYYYYPVVGYRSARFALMSSIDKLKWIYNSTLGAIFPKFQFNKWDSIDATNIVDTIFKVHGHQIFKNGLFNGDPHIDNIWLLNDNKIGLIDYGQVKELDPTMIESIKLLYKGILENNVDKTVDAYIKMGYKSQLVSDLISSTPEQRQLIFEKCILAYDKEDVTYFKKMNMIQYMEKLEKQDKTITIPKDIIMVMRTSFLLRGLGAMLTGQRISTAQKWKDFID